MEKKTKEQKLEQKIEKYDKKIGNATKENKEAESKAKLFQSKAQLKSQRRAFDEIEGSYLEKHAIGVAASKNLVPIKALQSQAMFVSDAKAFFTMTDQQLVEYYKNYDQIKKASNQRVVDIANTAANIKASKDNFVTVKRENKIAKYEKKRAELSEEKNNSESTKPTLTIPSLNRFDKVPSGGSTSYSGITKDGYSFDK